MKQYQLGPNGGIVTALNLFSTKFGQVTDLIKKAGTDHKYCILDTPGKYSSALVSQSSDQIHSVKKAHIKIKYLINMY